MYIQIIAAVVLIPPCLAGAAIALNRAPLRGSPGFVFRLKKYLMANVAETDAVSVYPELRPRHYAAAPQQTFAVVCAAIEALGWDLHNQIPTQFEARVTITTPLLRFKDDLRVRVQSESEERSYLLVRSRSRVGRGDFGANVRHILALYDSMSRHGARALDAP